MKKNYVDALAEIGNQIPSEMTQDEFRTELLKLQKAICDMVFEDGDENHRIDEVISFLERKAREEGVSYDPEFRKGIDALRRISKEIAISMAGKYGEDRVARTLEHITRSNYKFRNIYLTDGETETELDNVILTEAGFVILEVKNVKTDITISENGRILYSNEECFHDVSICDKMQTKRELLRRVLSNKLNERELDIPVRIDSYLVFSARKGVYFKITDMCHKEKYCYRGSLPYIIDKYQSEGMYSDAELSDLDSIMEEMETHKKRFFTELDFNEICAKIGAALDRSLEVPEEPCVNIVDSEAARADASKKERRNWRTIGAVMSGMAASFAAAMTGLLISRNTVYR